MLKIGDKVALLFTRVLDEMRLGPEEPEEPEAVDRSYWEQKASPGTLILADRVLELLRTFDSEVSLKYNRQYIGLVHGGQADNYTIFRPTKSYLRVEPRLDQSPEVETMLADAGLDVLDYDSRWGRYRVRVTGDDLDKNGELLTELMKRAWERSR